MNLFQNKWLNTLALFALVAVAVVMVQSMSKIVPDGNGGYKSVLGKAKNSSKGIKSTQTNLIKNCGE